MKERQPRLVLGTPAEAAANLETITDDLWEITRDAEQIALTEGETDQNFGWMRGLKRPLEDGSTLELMYTVERIEDNYACVIQTIPSPDGGKKIIQRRWSNTSPADASLQVVHGIRTRPGAAKLESGHVGFNEKDVYRLRKLLEMLKEANRSG